MTVKELKEKLQDYPDDYLILIDNGLFDFSINIKNIDRKDVTRKGVKGWIPCVRISVGEEF